jgi:hypothetical protein
MKPSSEVTSLRISGLGAVQGAFATSSDARGRRPSQAPSMRHRQLPLKTIFQGRGAEPYVTADMSRYGTQMPTELIRENFLELAEEDDPTLSLTVTKH